MESGEISRLEAEIIAQIRALKFSDARKGKETARAFFETGTISDLLVNYLQARRLSKAAAAREFNISTSSLDRLLNGPDLSENMVFRLRSALEHRIGDDARWRLAQNKKVQDVIGKVAKSLSELFELMQHSNSFNAGSKLLINEIQKAQLIAMLESMLASLKAPAIEERQVSGVIGWIKKILVRSAEKGIEKGVTDAFSAVVTDGEELLRELASQPILTDFDKLG